MGAVFSIDPERPFLDALAAGLIERAGGDPLALARMTVLLPTRRAVRALAEAFLRQGGGKPMLLPRLSPVGDLDAEELSILMDEGIAAEGADLPPPVPNLTRQLMLTRLVLGFGQARGVGPVSPSQAAPLAGELARFLDEISSEGCDLAKLEGLAPEEHAKHWQEVLKFLSILTQHWPQALKDLGCLDIAERRNATLSRQADAWRKNPPSSPIIAAGITGGVPAVAALIEAVAALPEGVVVLPGLDREASADDWQAIANDPAHPQYLIAGLLARLKCAPKDVRLWPAAKITGGPQARTKLLRAALSPATRTHRWGALSGLGADAVQDLQRLDCPGPQEEAAVIALLMRQQLEEPGATAALVTPDRDLARRVASELRRWAIDVDDSAGQPLARSPVGVFLRLLLQCAEEDMAPLPLLALLKHPLAAGGLDPAQFRDLARQLEIAALRGPRPAPGAEGLAAAVKTEALKDYIARLGAALASLTQVLSSDATDLESLATAHIRAAETLAASDTQDGAARLWRDPAGEAAALWFNELLAAAKDFPTLAGRDYPPLFESLLAGPVVRPPFGRHPRLFIWGLLEARLQQADLMILGGLNEGVWPARADSDPWLSRPMRKQFGLPPPEQRVGRAAHDFAQCLGAKRVVLTRAARVEGNPTVPSRWLLRLETVLRAAGLEKKLNQDRGVTTIPLGWQRRLDDPGEPKRIAAPAPCPPVKDRPRRLSVTQIETWLRDPYAIYARHILRLRALDPIDADPGAADRGEFIHHALNQFLHSFPGELPDDAEERLIEFGRTAFGEALALPNVRAFWWPRFERIAGWVVEAERDRRPGIAQSFGEAEGRMTLPGKAGPFELHGRADRIDRLKAGGLAILDYKTGALPAMGEVQAGYAPQLALEALIAAAGGFKGVPAAAAAALIYWRLSGGDPAGEEKAAAKDAAAAQRLAEDARQGLEKLIAAFDDPKTPYRAWPRPDKRPRYSDYTHLARVLEWLPGAGSGE